MTRSAIIVFVRMPELGKVKTRLAKTIGDARALHIYLLLLEHTRSIIEALDCDKYIFFATAVTSDPIWAPEIFIKKEQQGSDLGERMHYAFSELFSAGYDRILIIGSDCYELTATQIRTAFEKLETTDMVIGPASDGGYYLLGMKKWFPAVFQHIEWSTESVLLQTEAVLRSHQMPYELLPVLNDIDTEADLPEALKFRSGIVL